MLIDPSALPCHTGSSYPEPFRALVAGRSKRRLGDAAGLSRFGVNLVTLEPNSYSSMRHWHSAQDELVYVLHGEVTLITNEGETVLTAGMAAAFPAGEANGHHLTNRSNRPAVYLEIGDRTSDDTVTYPDVDLQAIQIDRTYVYTHKDGTPYKHE